MEATRWDSRRFEGWVRSELRRLQWQPADLARRLDVPNGTVSRWLSGGRRPSSESALRIADVLGADQDLVLALTGHRETETALPTIDDRQRLQELLKRVRLTPDRAAGIEATLRAWIDYDRDEAREGDHP